MDNVNVFHLVVAPNWEKDLSKMATSNHSLELIENHRLNQTCGYLWIPQTCLCLKKKQTGAALMANLKTMLCLKKKERISPLGKAEKP
ncbi:hypothetical protein OUZ56_012117 [Daphnia magna]|uniref:Uncharacterized protein n=1 Tax=Daphnia magna TaxID=35525 RepID=A0ABQ9Z2B1_9CRUS|nr:hypothetical protein OUZ56_012117 [Daphnia magna]